MLDIAKANPDLETMKLAFFIASSIIGLLLLIIGFFLAQQFKVLRTVTETVNNLKTIVEVIKSRQLGDSEFCGLKHKAIDEKFKDHDKRLDADEKDIAVLQEKVKRI